ncbi:MAG: MerR family transcriptional regulator [Kiloniellaceae bacterium]
MASVPSETGPERRGGKSAAAFRTISEVAGELDVPQHVLRFWETKFSQIKPLKRGGGRRYYRPEDIALLRRIKTLLYNDGYTIKGVQKLLREGAAKTEPGDGAAPTRAAEAAAPSGLSPERRATVEDVLNELVAVQQMLKRGS